ncbi:hypothetical protein HYDPIDRAFT_113666 [Hydnomerulius pinastri MD-312]|uniref:Uracil-DNA glycosylase-like domain-containing protein n=1 Tax=Hydnomerulius pinastri MD-312 TaxID=994086 RepID=A0A0C9W7E9_9AGAM|nr:hypothetical protein HYDPIDRAFT_113666 [Hydnomerulius pinastri MD-312]
MDANHEPGERVDGVDPSTASPTATSSTATSRRVVRIVLPHSAATSGSSTGQTLNTTVKRKSGVTEEVLGSHKTRPPSKKLKGPGCFKDPEVYAHFHPLQDYLEAELDVVFCGINPGYMSAETGHHFANPTNHFWRCLHRSGLTSTLVLPSEDYSLPEQFNLGLTNLVDRPSTKACELSKSEMIASVPAFLNKIARHRPRFVCFVGMMIWEIVKSSLAKMPDSSDTSRCSASTSSEKPGASPKSKELVSERRAIRSAGKGEEKGRVGLQAYKLVHPDAGAGAVQETLFFVVPCTSGRVVKYQLSDKITLFTELHTLVQKASSDIDTSAMKSVVMGP